MPSERIIKIVVITGSVQPDNFTSKALKVAIDEIKKYPNVSVEFIDPGVLQLSLPGKEEGSSNESLQKIVSQSTGILIGTPEYHGSYSSVIKLVIDNLGYPSVMVGKPIALLGVASGQIGAIKALEHLRSVCAHVGGIVLPNSISVPFVDTMFDAQGLCLDPKVEKKIRGLAKDLLEFIQNHIWPKECQEENVRQ